MNRRGFLGSVIGVVAGQSFLAKLITDPFQRKILPFKMAFHEVYSHELVQAPGVQAVEKVGNGFTFVAEDLHATRTLVIDSVHLFTEKNELITIQRFDGDIQLINGDTLKCKSSIDISGIKVNTVDELVRLALQRQKGKINGGHL